MGKLIDLATDPEQYSSGRAVTWVNDDVRQKKQQENFWNAISPYIKAACQSALDIGCGSGWSAEKFSKLGSKWEGLEPSSSHFEIAHKVHPKFNILNITFEEYNTYSHFDCVIALMVFSHIKDVRKSFEKIFSLLNKGGTFIIICSTYHDEANRVERNGRKYEVEVIDDNQYVDKAIVGAYGIADINRKSEYYINEAVSSGYSLVKHLKVEDIGYSPKDLFIFSKS